MALDEISVKKGSTFAMNCVARDDDNTPFNLTGWTINSALRFQNKLLGYFTVTPVNLTLGQYTLSGLPTSNWPTETLQVDIKYTSQSGVISYTDTFYIICQASVTP